MTLIDQNTQPKLSLVVATMNRVEELKKFLDSLCNQSMRMFEVIIIDQSHCEMQPFVECISSDYGSKFAVRYIRDEGKGLSRARNLGLRYASGEYIGFPDDDCWYAESVIEQVITYFNNNKFCGILSGCYTEPNVDNLHFSAVEATLSHRNLHGRACSVGIFLNLANIGKHDIVFDERIGAGTEMPAGEEIDLLLRLLMKGVKGIYDPTLIVFHKIHRNKAITLDQFLAFKKAYWYVVGKNYCLFHSEIKVLRGVASIFIKKTPFPLAMQIYSIYSGFAKGLEVRNILSKR